MTDSPEKPAPAPDTQFQSTIEAFRAFNPNTTRWSEFNALAMVYASNLAYKDEPTIQSVAAACGFNRVSVRNGSDVQAFIAGSKEAVVVAFRGTRPDELVDWMTDFNARQIDFSERFDGPEVGNTHQGFSLGLLQVWAMIVEDVAQFQDGAQTLWITGHSLGGALAMLCAGAFTFARREPINGLYTFGQPRVGDLTWVAQCDSHVGNVHFRFVNDEDIVTRVPPRIYPHLPYPSFYGHSGQVMYFDDKGVLHTDETWWNQFLIRFDVGFENMVPLLEAPVKDHDLLNGYAANIAAFINAPKPGQEKPLTF